MTERHRVARPLRSAAGTLATLSLATQLLLASATPAATPALLDVPRPLPAPSEDAGLPTWRPDLITPLFPGPVGELGTLGLPTMQSETTVGVSGSQIVAGFNDFRGATSFSGVIYSTNGGASFNDFGQLPIGGGTSVSGDPVIAVYNPPVGPAVFYYSSIFFTAGGVQSMCVHSSITGGASWAGPLLVTPTSIGGQAADKEWIAIDPETGRLFMSWTQFAPGSTMRTTYSDDGGTTWSPSILLESVNVQGSVIVADPNSSNVYCAWRKRVTTTTSETHFSRSTDNGVSWSAPSIASTHFETYPAFGMDRFNSFPSMAVNPADGGIELVYVGSQTGTDAGDFGDVLYRRSTDAGASWSAPLQLNVEAGLGAGRPQIFPTVSADASGRVDVAWYDQSVGSGVSDLSDMFTSYSVDFGASFEPPAPVTQKPFHDEVGNDFGAPHQGDYIQGVSVAGAHYVCFAWFNEPNPLGTSADAMVSINSAPADVPTLRIRPGDVALLDDGCMADGFLVASETATLRLTLENFGPATHTGILGKLSSLTPGVNADTSTHSYPDIGSGLREPADNLFNISVNPDFVCGPIARFRLDLFADGTNPTFVEFSLPTGVVTTTTVLMNEGFDSATPPNGPPGWTSSALFGPAAPWRTTTVTPASGPNAMFCPDTSVTTFIQLQGPAVAIPAGTTYVDFEFNTKYNLEQQDSRIAFDGASWGYLLDASGGTHFASADALEFDLRYTHWVNRAAGNNRGDRSGYSGNSGVSYQTARIRIPNLAGHTINPRWHMTTDASVGAGGWWVDDVRITAYQYTCGTCAVGIEDRNPASFAVLGMSPNPTQSGGSVAFTLPRPAPVWAAVMSVDGRRVKTLASGSLYGAGLQRLAWDGTDACGRRAPAGVYWVSVRSGLGAGNARVVVLP